MLLALLLKVTNFFCWQICSSTGIGTIHVTNDFWSESKFVKKYFLWIKNQPIVVEENLFFIHFTSTTCSLEYLSMWSQGINRNIGYCKMVMLLDSIILNIPRARSGVFDQALFLTSWGCWTWGKKPLNMFGHYECRINAGLNVNFANYWNLWMAKEALGLHKKWT